MAEAGAFLRRNAAAVKRAPSPMRSSSALPGSGAAMLSPEVVPNENTTSLIEVPVVTPEIDNVHIPVACTNGLCGPLASIEPFALEYGVVEPTVPPMIVFCGVAEPPRPFKR